MESWKRGLSSGRRLVAMFLGVALLLGAILLWLGWQLARQDRGLATRRQQEHQEIVADLAVAALQKSLLQAEEQLAALAALPVSELRKKAATSAESLPADGVMLVVRGAGVEAYPANRLPFYPAVTDSSPPPAALFAAADALEFRQSEYVRALAALRELASARQPDIRAAALLRTARILRKQGRWEQALAAYREMSTLHNATVDGLPADLVACHARLQVFEQQRRSHDTRAEAGALRDGLRRRRWHLTRGTYEFYDEEARRGLGQAPDVDTNGEIALAGAVESLYEEWRHARSRSGRRILYQDGRGLLALWRESDGHIAAMVLGTQWLEAQWTGTFRSASGNYGVAVGLTDAEGHAVLGRDAARSPRSTVRLASATQLPWNLNASTTNPEAVLLSSRARERWLMASMSAVALLILGAAWLVGRAVSRELALSRQQSDFVSAVSHEFRTPLTSMCLLSEQLASGRVSSESDRAQYYEVLSSESGRLRRLVEGLLNFGRMESGAAEYRLETIDPAELVQEVSRQLERDSSSEGRRIEVSVHPNTPLVRADRAALACAVWNLLDNALKYSPGHPTVWAGVDREDGCAAIRIRDQGIGIPAAEQGRIFEKFARGEAAKQAGIRGTGVGLAMVRHIVAAHHGEVRVESRPGEGSTFTLLLPVVS
jgi:signal transduction histidine kinase/tetratricopeptide (TPR) repeat protein